GEAGRWDEEKWAAGARQGADHRIAVNLGEQCRGTPRGVVARTSLAFDQEHLVRLGEVRRDRCAGDPGTDDDDVRHVCRWLKGTRVERLTVARTTLDCTSRTWGMRSSFLRMTELSESRSLPNTCKMKSCGPVVAKQLVTSSSSAISRSKRATVSSVC